MEDTNYLAHHGILGQKWGVRRYQNEDGTLTPEGKEHYGYSKESKHESSTETHQRMLKNARENDRWDVSFLEYIPDTWTNPKTGDFYDREVVLKEYAEYLEDPNKWAEKHLDANRFMKHTAMSVNTGAFETSAINTLLTGGAGNIAVSTIIANCVKEGY